MFMAVSRSREFLPASKTPKTTIGLTRHFVEPSRYLPTSDCQIDVDALFNVLGHAELTRLVMDDTMTPRIRGSACVVAIRQLGWAKFDFEPRSFLTVLTNQGSLSLYKLKGDDWIEMANVSKIWLDRSAPLWNALPDNPSNNDLLAALQERSYRLKITAFAWTGPKSTSNLLFTGSMDGTICAWEVSRDPSAGQLELELLRGLETDQQLMITSLTIIQTDQYKCLLVYAVFNGRIQAIPVSITDIVEFHEQSEIWDENDNIVVPPGGLMAETILGYVILAAAKGAHLSVFLMTSEGQLLSYTSMNSGDVAITGLHFVTPNELFMTTRSGKIAGVSVAVASDATIKLSSSSIDSPMKNDNMGIMGAAFSKTKTIIALSCSAKANFNHIVVRECSSKVFCTSSELVSPYNVVKSHKGLLSEIWDALEVIRIKFLKNPEKDFTMLHSLVDSDQFDTMDVTQLKKNLWFLNALLNSLIGEEGEKNYYLRLGEQIYDLITAHHVFKRATTLLSYEKQTHETRLSLTLIKKWIEYFETNLDPENFPSTRGILTIILEQLKACEFITMGETCDICGAGPEEDVFTGFKNWRCSQQHEFPRCSITFMQCLKLPHYVCRSCDIIVHPYAVENENYKLCIYCDGFLQNQDNVLDDSALLQLVE
ncbi:Hypothetical protein NTJ_09140 [Nesidiocoris tenuis]|uniref:Transcription factor IIIC 90kDa subunit N-terminal domain-containing protein n=1 Tax=Nesidiocoris tenuis TaxID=355587 RepID=A0ABN7AZK6_9HEMI|nr:Hypothetical protein NTJ_09140 [Nesidiocoris tenuis]